VLADAGTALVSGASFPALFTTEEVVGPLGTQAIDRGRAKLETTTPNGLIVSK
jgi:hypothetical protein